MSERIVTVQLTPFEARALIRAAEFFSGVLANTDRFLPEGFQGCDHNVRPLDSGAMKLSTSLVCEGCEL